MMYVEKHLNNHLISQAENIKYSDVHLVHVGKLYLHKTRAIK